MKKSIVKSSGNVFEDMGLPDSDHELLKAKLTLQIHRIIASRKLTQVAAAALLGTTQPQVSSLMRLRPTSLSVGRLMEFLTILGQDIEVTLRPAKRRRAGQVVVNVAA
jgi:predicted XRE-type DNA-binding protein